MKSPRLFGDPAAPSTPKERWPLVQTLALFAAAWLVLSWPWLSGAVTIPWDAKAHFYPQLQFLAQSLHRGELPFWAPYVFSGAPQIADPQSLIFSPPFLALAWLDPNPSFRTADATVLAMLGLGGMAIVALFRDRGWHPAGAIVAALAFAFGAAAAWRIQHVGQILSLAWLPIALWLLTRALERRSPGYGLAAGVVAGLMVLGRDQVAYLGVWTLIGAVVAHWLDNAAGWRAIRASAVPLACGAIGGALVVTVPVLLTLVLTEGSNRAAIDYVGAGQGSLHPALLLTAFAANLFGADGPLQNHWGPPSPLWGPVDLFLARNMGQAYIGALPIVLIMTAALQRGALWAREIRFFTVLAALMLLYALGRYTPFFRATFEIVPGVDLFRRPADAVFLLGFAAAVLSGYLVHRWCAGGVVPATPARRAVAAILILVPMALCVAVPIAKDTFPLAH
ncbi:MAG TPA: glycosyltransferase family 39 protein, partial [Beijerinckiaceae bacterium]|nr:glycosyltransferase family 39 protein [Beijerinckiaceae bacterium]